MSVWPCHFFFGVQIKFDTEAFSYASDYFCQPVTVSVYEYVPATAHFEFYPGKLRAVFWNGDHQALIKINAV